MFVEQPKAKLVGMLTTLKTFEVENSFFCSFPIVIPIKTNKLKGLLGCILCRPNQIFKDSHPVVEWEKLVTWGYLAKPVGMVTTLKIFEVEHLFCYWTQKKCTIYLVLFVVEMVEEVWWQNYIRSKTDTKLQLNFLVCKMLPKISWQLTQIYCCFSAAVFP